MFDEKLHVEHDSIKVWRLTYIINLVVLSIITIGYILFVPSEFGFKYIGYIVLGILLSISLLTIIFIPRFKYNYWRYNLTHETLTLEFGILWRKSIVIPINRIQYVDTSQGIILRKYNLIDLTIFTAGGKITIPCLSLQVAETLKNEIARLVRREDLNAL